MAKSAKIAVSMDPDLVAAADRLAESRGESRSAVVARALRAYLGVERRQREIRRYVEALTEAPETAAEIAAVDGLGAAALEAVPWAEE